MLKSFSMSFDDHLLARGFWLYVWEVKDRSPTTSMSGGPATVPPRMLDHHSSGSANTSIPIPMRRVTRWAANFGAQRSFMRIALSR